MTYYVLIFGCTGLVGKTVLDILEKRKFPIHKLYLVASSGSVGKKIKFKSKEYSIISGDSSFDLKKIDILFFCASANLSKCYTPIYVDIYSNILIIDNSSCWRMSQHIPIIIPPINKHILHTTTSNIVSNSNCTTAGLVLFLNPIKEIISEIHVVAIQSCSGSGMKGLYQLEDERNGGENIRKYYDCDIDQNLIPKIGDFVNNIVDNRISSDTSEEMKLLLETNKILGTNFHITATCIRCPIERGHSLVVTVHTNKDIDSNWLEQRLLSQNGLVFLKSDYTTPKQTVSNQNVFVSRVRYNNKRISAFITFDNLYRGASWNSVEIAECYITNI